MGLAGHCERLLCIGGCHFGSEIAAVVQSKGVAAKQGFRCDPDRSVAVEGVVAYQGWFIILQTM